MNLRPRDQLVLGPHGLWWYTPWQLHHFRAPQHVPAHLLQRLVHWWALPQLWLDPAELICLPTATPQLSARDKVLLITQRWQQQHPTAQLLSVHQGTAIGANLHAHEKLWLEWLGQHHFNTRIVSLLPLAHTQAHGNAQPWQAMLIHTPSAGWRIMLHRHGVLVFARTLAGPDADIPASAWQDIISFLPRLHWEGGAIPLRLLPKALAGPTPNADSIPFPFEISSLNSAADKKNPDWPDAMLSLQAAYCQNAKGKLSQPPALWPDAWYIQLGGLAALLCATLMLMFVVSVVDFLSTPPSPTDKIKTFLMSDDIQSSSFFPSPTQAWQALRFIQTLPTVDETQLTQLDYVYNKAPQLHLSFGAIAPAGWAEQMASQLNAAYAGEETASGNNTYAFTFAP